MCQRLPIVTHFLSRVAEALPQQKIAAACAMLCASLAISLPAEGTPITMTGSGVSGVSGNLLAASATFAASGTNLVVTLTNTSLDDVTLQADILTALFFDVSGPLLGLDASTGSAVVPLGSTVLFGGTDAGGVVGGEWGYAEGIGAALSAGTGGSLTQQYGLGSSGLGVFGPPSFPGTNLQGPAGVDGLQYGLTPAADNPLTGQGAVTGGNALIQDTIVLTLAGLPLNFDPYTAITHVFFQYGTALVPTDPGLPGSPEPATVALLAMGGVVFLRRRRAIPN